ncbi:MAG TPA: tripartite tricarboxylate transporter TctB family protein [Terrimesophilobacter sp.]|nr:tripartite tricarboxylate transporter TctB family protein [Terrimesophilobacter sp.]HRP98884.1 tripartite tricarboxylate transporter TctB family protein [Terrimesophilobacter sp.]
MTSPNDTDDVLPEAGSQEPPQWASWTAALTVAVIGVVLLVGALSIPGRAGQPLGPNAFPTAVGIVALGVGLTLVTQLVLVRRRRGASAPAAASADEADKPETTRRWVSLGATVAAVIAYTFLLQPVGYVLSTVAFFVTVCRLMGSRAPIRDLIIGAVIALTIYFGFNGLLGVRLPGGILDFGI